MRRTISEYFLKYKRPLLIRLKKSAHFHYIKVNRCSLIRYDNNNTNYSKSDNHVLLNGQTIRILSIFFLYIKIKGINRTFSVLKIKRLTKHFSYSCTCINMYLFSILQMRLFMKNDDTNSITPENDEVVFSVQ